MSESLRTKLIDVIRQLPAEQLPLALGMLSRLQSGDFALQSTNSQQRLAARIVSGLEDQRNETGIELPTFKSWPHAPMHRISEYGTYIVTAGTAGKDHLFRGPERLDLLESKLLELAVRFRWDLEAWAVFSNHYHFVANSASDSQDLRTFITHLHAETAVDLNRFDNRTDGQVWFNYWDTQLTFEASYLARLNYVHQNAARHGLVPVANQYRWCSDEWFERMATPAQIKTIYGFKTDRIKVIDDYDPL